MNWKMFGVTTISITFAALARVGLLESDAAWWIACGVVGGITAILWEDRKKDRP